MTFGAPKKRCIVSLKERFRIGLMK